MSIRGVTSYMPADTSCLRRRSSSPKRSCWRMSLPVDPAKSSTMPLKRVLGSSSPTPANPYRPMPVRVSTARRRAAINPRATSVTPAAASRMPMMKRRIISLHLDVDDLLDCVRPGNDEQGGEHEHYLSGHVRRERMQVVGIDDRYEPDKGHGKPGNDPA